MLLRVHSTISHSVVNGPGERFVVWVQGCTLGCAGCANADACTTDGGRDVSVEELAQEIVTTAGIEGLTLSGGEPFQQPAAVAQLCRRARTAGLSVFIFTGYTLDELRNSLDPAVAELLRSTDILLAGRYVQDRHTHKLWRGSDNQTVHFLSNRYRAADFDLEREVTEAEITIDEHGEMRVTGFPEDDEMTG